MGSLYLSLHSIGEVRTDYLSIADDPRYKNLKTGKVGQKAFDNGYFDILQMASSDLRVASVKSTEHVVFVVSEELTT